MTARPLYQIQGEMHPLDELLEWLPELDFGVMAHGWVAHGRDYLIVVQNVGASPGTFELTFTHCVSCAVETRVRDDVWPESWGDEFINYQAWLDAGEPEGYVWGVEWSNAYPGLESVPDSETALSWSNRLGRPMFESTLETNQFFMRLVYHSIRSKKISDDTSTMSRVHIPLRSGRDPGRLPG